MNKFIEYIAVSLGIKKRPQAILASSIQKIIGKNIAFEIGGPSKIFSKDGLLPVYSYLSLLDTGNFSDYTIWQKDENDRGVKIRKYGIKERRRYVAEATDLSAIKDKSYDLFLASHVIEHIANPIMALKEWCRVIKDNGVLLIVFPEKSGTFDHNRPLTSIEHMIEDYKLQVKEDDDTHIQEVMKLHDIEMDAGISNKEELMSRIKENYKNRSMHHHVFDLHTATQLVVCCGMQVIYAELLLPSSIVILAKKSGYEK